MSKCSQTRVPPSRHPTKIFNNSVTLCGTTSWQDLFGANLTRQRGRCALGFEPRRGGDKIAQAKRSAGLGHEGARNWKACRAAAIKAQAWGGRLRRPVRASGIVRDRHPGLQRRSAAYGLGFRKVGPSGLQRERLRPPAVGTLPGATGSQRASNTGICQPCATIPRSETRRIMALAR
jgi:hypothetical protein